MTNDKRLIEDYLPIVAISAEASREKSVRKGHISTLHLWWARRPLVACRAAVYGTLVPADRWVKEVELKGLAIDPASRFYVLWRFVYKAAEIDADEAIVFTYAQHVELDGPNG